MSQSELLLPILDAIAREKRHIFLLHKMLRNKVLTSRQLKELKRYEKAENRPPAFVETQSEVARIFNMTIRTVQYWISEGMPRNAKGYDLLKIQAWRFLRNQQRENRTAESEFWNTRYREAKSMQAELKIKQLKNTMISREEAEKICTRRFSALNKAFLSLARTLPPRLAGLDVDAVEVFLEEKIRETFSQFEKASSPLESFAK